MNEKNLDDFVKALETSLAKNTFVKLTLSKYKGDEEELRNVYARVVSIKKKQQFSILKRYARREEVKNYSFKDGLFEIRSMLVNGFRGGNLFTTERDLTIALSRNQQAALKVLPPTFSDAPPATHDREKQRYIELEGNVYLRELGVTNAEGDIRQKQGDKFRQINKFVEIVSGLFDSSLVADKSSISIVDMGAGKGYLTFALYDYFNRVRNLRADVLGVEARSDLVANGNRIALRSGFERLRFLEGDIAGFVPREIDILIALHACDTATDDAIFKGIKAKAEIIITAPCCHKELRPQMQSPEVLRGVLRHGLMLERQAEAVTDGMRALLLESAGYAVKVFEFVSTEHTRKNTMISGVRRKETARTRAELMNEFESLKAFYGIREQRLEKLLRRESGGT